MPASKSFAQRAILAAALAEGTSHLYDYSSCEDSEAALQAARELGADVQQDGSTLIITGIGPIKEDLGLPLLNAGESGLLSRLSIPVLSAINGIPFALEGYGTLTRRPMNEAASIMAAFGVLLSNLDDSTGRQIHVPLTVRGRLIPGNAEVSGASGSQLISGLLMALPLCPKDSELHVSEPKSLPYMYITLDVLRHFGISTRSEMEGNAQMLENEDWSACTGINFRIRGGQSYKAADLGIESDWSAAAAFLAAGAIFGSVEIDGLDMKSIQADIAIIDVLVEAGAMVSQLEGGTVCVRRAPLNAFTFDLNHAPDLFPVVAVLAAFCGGESRVGGLGRLASKESDRATAILEMLQQMYIVPEEFTLPQMRFADYVATYRPFYPAFSDEILRRCMDEFHLPLDVRIDQLSMGDKKKALMSFALATNVPYLLMDEPTNGLDVLSKKQFRKVIATTMTEERTLIIATHQLHDVESLLDHVLILQRSQLLLNASVADLCEKYTFDVRPDDALTDNVLYTERTPQGNATLSLRQPDDEETQLNLELLFNAITSKNIQD